MSDTVPDQAGSPAKQAVAWFARHQIAPLESDEESRFAAWLRDPHHAAAYNKVQGMWAAFDHVPETDRLPLPTAGLREPAPVRRPLLSRPAFAWGAAALAACLVVANVAPRAIIAFRADAMTATGEIKTVALADGSHVTLNTNSAIAVEFHGGLRRIKLLQGEAEFAVAPDATHPFVVEAAGGTTRALGTVFAVRQDANDVRVTAIEHRIEIRQGSQVADLSPGQQIRYDGKLSPVTSAGPGADAWRRGHLVVIGHPLENVVTELNRYTHTRIVVLGDAARLNVNAVFPVTNTRASIAIMQTSMRLKAIWLTEYLVILRS